MVAPPPENLRFLPAPYENVSEVSKIESRNDKPTTLLLIKVSGSLVPAASRTEYSK
jgi:hypothetical protein